MPEMTLVELQTLIAESPIPVLVDFWGLGCAPCKMMAPIIDTLAIEYEATFKVVKFNISEDPTAIQTFNVRSVPTLIIFDASVEVGRLVGAKPKSAIQAFMDANT